MCINAVGPAACTAVSLVAANLLVTGDAQGQLQFVHLKAQHEVSQSNPVPATVFLSGGAPNVQGPGGQPPAPGGILEMAPLLASGHGVLNTDAGQAGSMVEEEAKLVRQVCACACCLGWACFAHGL